MTAINDPTNGDLTLALLDQKVAGIFAGRSYAYVAIIDKSDGYGLGIAELDVPGYSPIAGWKAETYAHAGDVADGMNAHIGLTDDEALRIVASSMRKRRIGR